MIVGVILPIWDRVEGSEVIKRLQTDDGEQLLGRMLGARASKQTLKNLGLDSGLSNMSAADLFNSIKNGNKAILSNGWEISTAKVNYEDRIEIKGRGSLTDAEMRVLKEQGAFIERINWAERVFIPIGDSGIETFERITASKPVVDLIEKNRVKKVDEVEQEHGIPKISTEQVLQAGSGADPARTIKSVSTMKVISMNNEKKPFHEMIAEKLIEQLKTGTAPWQRPWEPGEPNVFLPMNPTTGKRYKGVNAIELIMEGRGDPRWMTYRQAQTAGYQVQRGEKGTQVQYWKFTEERTRLDEEGRPVLDAEGKPIKEEITLERPRAFFATVFNAEQIDGIPAMERKPVAWNPVDRAEGILQASGVDINHNGGNRAFYRLTTDTIYLPDKSQFPSADRYYATALHELGHWTGHPSRLARDLGHPFGSEAYAREELRAEIASMILGDELGIGHDPRQHAAYVASWIKVLQDDPMEVFRAAAAAEKIQEFVLGLEQKQVLEQEARETGSTIAVNHEQEIAGMVIAEIERAMANTAYWEDQTAASEAAQMAQSAVRYMREGAYEGALSSLEDAGELEERYAGVSGPSFQGAAGVLKAEWDALAQTQHEHEEAIGMAQLKEESVKTALNEKGIEPEKIYLNVPFEEKEEVKSLGARWDRNKRSWYIRPGVDPKPFSRWARGAVEGQGGTQAVRSDEERQYLAVPYGERQAAKALGAKWDKTAKCWYIGPDSDTEKLSRWLPENVPGQRQAAALSPQEEFADALQSVGALVAGAHPIMDGKTHRIGVSGDKKGEQAGFYVAYLDGHPAGYIKNNRTGVEITWKSKGYVLSSEEKAKLQTDAAEKLQVRAVDEQRQHEETSQRIASEMTKFIPVALPTPYLASKQIAVQAGIFTDAEGKKTYVPVHDENGKVWTVQYTWEDGTKRFAKNSRKEGCFHAVGGLDELSRATAIVIAEGYATACSLSEVLGFSTVAAFDSGNLPAVAKALQGEISG